jgi:arginine decarboxylase-like protein
VAAPTLVSESGRALASHHTVLCFDVVSVSAAAAISSAAVSAAAAPSAAAAAAAISTSHVAIEAVAASASEERLPTDSAAAPAAYLIQTCSEVLATMDAHNCQVGFILCGACWPCFCQVWSGACWMDSDSPYGDLTVVRYFVCQEAFNDAAQFRDEARQMFRLGLMTLAQAALMEDLYAAICARALQVRCW